MLTEFEVGKEIGDFAKLLIDKKRDGDYSEDTYFCLGVLYGLLMVLEADISNGNWLDLSTKSLQELTAKMNNIDEQKEIFHERD